MTDWLTKLVVGGEGNVIRDRSFTNWNTFDASEVIAQKEREKASLVPTSTERPADSNEGGPAEKD